MTHSNSIRMDMHTTHDVSTRDSLRTSREKEPGEMLYAAGSNRR